MKPWWKSKTVWVNVLTLIVALVTALQNHEWIKDNPDMVAAATMILAVVNVFLRWLVDQPITSIAKPMDRFRRVTPNVEAEKKRVDKTVA